jgi:transposase
MAASMLVGQVHDAMNGARVGDLFMSLIHTCELNKVNPFDYLTTLLRHPAELKASQAEWIPWNYLGAATTVAA